MSVPGAKWPILTIWLVCARVAAGFVNWESAHVHPLDVTPGQPLLLAVNTPDNRLEVFDITGGSPVYLRSIPVGLSPISVRALSANEAWVVNHISDSVSIVDLAAGNVVATLQTLDEPSDVVFAGTPLRAFVSCSQANAVMVFDPADLAVDPAVIAIDGEDPRAMAVSPDGNRVYAAIFHSGNRSTILSGGVNFPPDQVFPPFNVVNNVQGPYGGTNPPPNDGTSFSPPMNPANPAPPRVGLIVRKNAAGRWVDDNTGDWTAFVSGSNSYLEGRPVGWDLYDHDVAVIDASSLSVSYVTGLINVGMGLAVNPISAEIVVVGTDATNVIRYEPNLRGTFTRVHAAVVDADTLAATDIVDLNPHLDYAVSTVSQDQRDLSIGDPRGMVFNSAGTRAFVTGMGSNNVLVIDSGGNRVTASPVEVGQGPTGVMLDEARSRLYVLNKFEATISAVHTGTLVEASRTPLYDPTPDSITRGRRHLYDTHATSGLGHSSCASCHVDARTDRISWDLGNPAGTMKSVAGQNRGGDVAGLNTGFQNWHPMKGPMLTQTLQAIIGLEPFHWRGDRDGLEQFRDAFTTLMGDDTTPTSTEMQQFETFLASIHLPPNPFRNLDNSLPTSLPLAGHYTPGRFAPAGQPLPNGNAVRGLALFRNRNLVQVGALRMACTTCHTLPTGVGTNLDFNGGSHGTPIPAGPNGELHHALMSIDGSTNISMKVPYYRSLYERTGYDKTQLRNRAGFGFSHDGAVDSLARFVSGGAFALASDQDIADLVAISLAFSGSDMPLGSVDDPLEPLGPASLDTHAAVGAQATVNVQTQNDPDVQDLITTMLALADSEKVGLVAKGIQNGSPRGYTYTGANIFQSDRANEFITATELRAAGSPGSEVTFTVVPAGSQTQIGIDRDEDGHFDLDELEGCSDPADPQVVPPLCVEIPTVSQWGLAVLALMTITAGAVVLRRRPDAHRVARR